MKLYTADWHLYHDNIRRFCQRPFKDLYGMHSVLWENWDELSHPGDVLYYLGDLILHGHRERIRAAIERFGVQVVFLIGNHDDGPRRRKLISETANVVWCGDLKREHIGPDKIPTTLCHYPMRSWAQKSYGAIQLHGHSHGSLPQAVNQLDVGVDNAVKLLGAYRPFTEEEVMECVRRS